MSRRSGSAPGAWGPAAAVVQALLAHGGGARSPEVPGPGPPARAAIG